MPRRLAATVLVTVIAAALLAPAGALAQTPFAPLPSAGTTTEEALPTSTTTEDEGLERWQEILIFLGGVVFVLGIGYAVLRDARKRAPVDDEDRYYRETADKSGPDPRKKAKARARAKAQRQARRRNR